MKKQFVLDEQDIIQTISNSFSVDTDKVHIDRRYEEDGESFGLKEKIIVTVEVPMNDQR